MGAGRISRDLQPLRKMKLPGVWHVGIDGTQTVCPVCDSLSATRKTLEENAAEWICSPCPAHKAHHEKIKHWLEKQNAPLGPVCKNRSRSGSWRKRSPGETQTTFQFD